MPVLYELELHGTAASSSSVAAPSLAFADLRAHGRLRGAHPRTSLQLRPINNRDADRWGRDSLAGQLVWICVAGALCALLSRILRNFWPWRSNAPIIRFESNTDRKRKASVLEYGEKIKNYPTSSPTSQDPVPSSEATPQSSISHQPDCPYSRANSYPYPTPQPQIFYFATSQISEEPEEYTSEELVPNTYVHQKRLRRPFSSRDFNIGSESERINSQGSAASYYDVHDDLGMTTTMETEQSPGQSSPSSHSSSASGSHSSKITDPAMMSPDADKWTGPQSWNSASRPLSQDAPMPQTQSQAAGPPYPLDDEITLPNPRRRSYTAKLKPFDPPQASTVSTDDSILPPFSMNKSISPPLPTPTVNIQEEIMVAEGWRRHTRVYGGGVCLACLESEKQRRLQGMEDNLDGKQTGFA